MSSADDGCVIDVGRRAQTFAKRREFAR